MVASFGTKKNLIRESIPSLQESSVKALTEEEGQDFSCWVEEQN